MFKFTAVIALLMVALVQLQLASAFAPLRTRAMMKPVAAFDFNSIMVLAVEAVEQAEDYKYGAVAAPAWALPLGAVLVIATAAIPILLKPGQDAIDEQRKNEEIVGSTFNKRKDKDLR